VLDIGRTLENLKEMSFDREDLAADEAIILRGCVETYSTTISTLICSHRPQPGQLNIYKDALERLNTSIAFNTTDMDISVTVYNNVSFPQLPNS
jgi:exocyst complex protein 7